MTPTHVVDAIGTAAPLDGPRLLDQVAQIEKQAEQHEAEAARLRKLLSDLRDALNGRARKKTGKFSRRRRQAEKPSNAPAEGESAAAS